MSPMIGSVRSLLLVDDEELNTDMLSRRLSRSGFHVEIARSGAEALALVATQHFDLVLLDQMMPQMSGREVLEQIRKVHTLESLPVIMVTAIAESERIADALEAGANDYITKPIDFRVTLARINAQLARRDAEAALRKSEERYALAAKASRDAIWDWDLVAGTVYYSDRWMEMLGLSPDHVSTGPETWFSRVFISDRETLQGCIDDAVSGAHGAFDCHYRAHHQDGRIRWMSTRAVVTRNAAGEALRLSGSQSDVTDEKTRDALTGLLNRVALKSQLEHLFLSAQSAGSETAPPYSLLFLDLDGFKAVNDSFGHLAGDQLLSAVAGRLRDAAVAFTKSPAHPGCNEITVARVSGDEFAILLQSTHPQEHAVALATAVEQGMTLPVALDGHSIHVNFSIGAACGNVHHATYEELLADADVAMYAAKTEGRGSVAIFSPDMRRAVLDRLTLENDLRGAVSSGAMYLVYQPKVRLATGAVYGVEALLRWNHPNRGHIPPSEFIPIAEQTGQIVEIGRWVLQTACTQLLEWHGRYPLAPPLELSVNLSPREFKQDELVETIAAVLGNTGFPPACLHLEITEGVLFENFTEARAKLIALQQLGVLLDLDDFGSGYSSLRYLRELPFDTLKIDRYFIASLDSDSTNSSAEMIEAILAMAGTLGLKVVAEGIETLPHSDLLKQLGCESGQGYYFSRPLAVPAMHDVLTRELERVQQESLREADTKLDLAMREVLSGATP